MISIQLLSLYDYYATMSDGFYMFDTYLAFDGRYSWFSSDYWVRAKEAGLIRLLVMGLSATVHDEHRAHRRGRACIMVSITTGFHEKLAGKGRRGA